MMIPVPEDLNVVVEVKGQNAVDSVVDDAMICCRSNTQVCLGEWQCFAQPMDKVREI